MSFAEIEHVLTVNEARTKILFRFSTVSFRKSIDKYNLESETVFFFLFFFFSSLALIILWKLRVDQSILSRLFPSRAVNK